MISPHFEKASTTTEGVEFIKVDVDDAPVSSTVDSNAMTFTLITDSACVHRKSLNSPELGLCLLSSLTTRARL